MGWSPIDRPGALPWRRPRRCRQPRSGALQASTGQSGAESGPGRFRAARGRIGALTAQHARNRRDGVISTAEEPRGSAQPCRARRAYDGPWSWDLAGRSDMSQPVSGTARLAYRGGGWVLRDPQEPAGLLSCGFVIRRPGRSGWTSVGWSTHGSSEGSSRSPALSNICAILLRAFDLQAAVGLRGYFPATDTRCAISDTRVRL
jgi:hypothetical protein